jgi:DNA-binding protein WhiA
LEQNRSFAIKTKEELAHMKIEKKCCMLAEIAGFIRVCGSVKLVGGGKFDLVITTENNAITRRYKRLIKEYFDVKASADAFQVEGLRKGKVFSLRIPPEEKSEQVLRESGILMVREGLNYISDGIYEGLIKTKCCKKAYLRGMFLGAGILSNPYKSYHIEFVCSTQTLANDVKKLINSFVDLHAKTVQRKKNYIVYVKESGQIIDILNIIGAHSHLFAFEDVRVLKEMRNKANRASNCDSANMDKALIAAEKQLANINKIAEVKGLRFLPDKLFEVAIMRLENPDVSLVELAEMMEPPMKKSGVNNRLKKIEEIANNL